MLKITASIDGMACAMCEAHINDAVRSHFAVKKVTSSHKQNETVILAEQEITAEALNAALDGSCYRVLAVRCEPYQKKGLFHRG